MNVSAYASSGNGWIAGLGDPTPMGWFTVFAYFATGVLCLSCAAKPLFSSEFDDQKIDLRFWLTLAALMFLLAVNKQLDLQTLMTMFLKSIAGATGLYDARRVLQLVFIVAIVAGGTWLAWKFFVKYRRSAERNRLAVIGLALLVVFVAIRATSFHYMDSLINATFAGLRLNWIFEIGSIGLIATAGFLHLRRRRTQVKWQGKLAHPGRQRDDKSRSNRFKTGELKNRATKSRTSTSSRRRNHAKSRSNRCR